MSLKSLFKRQKPHLMSLEENAVKLNKDIFDLLVRCEKNLDELKGALNSDKPYVKDAKMAELENKFLNLRTKIDAIRNDMRSIMDIETQNKDFIGINDDIYFTDKMNRLDAISAALDELVELAGEKPAANELRGMTDFIYGKINIVVDAVNNIINDDKQLENTYSKIQYL
jgi:hypothetical protein